MTNKENKTTNSLENFIQDESMHSFTVIQGRTFRKGPILRGVVALIIGGFFIFQFFKLIIEDGGQPIFILLLLFGMIGLISGSLILFARDGVEINTKRMEIMEFMRFGLNWGNWKSIKNYPSITVIKLHKTVFYGSYIGKFAGERGSYSRFEDNDEFEVCLLTPTHHQRITLAISKNYNEAKMIADALVKKMDLQYEDFNPVRISNRKSRSRK